jgi:hypothetical protein
MDNKVEECKERLFVLIFGGRKAMRMCPFLVDILQRFVLMTFYGFMLKIILKII